MQLAYTRIETPFRYPFTISKGTKTHQSSLVVALSIGPFTGFGEAPAIHYYDVTVDKMIAELEAKRKMVERFALTDPERYWHYLHHLFPKSPFLVCALDMAAWDLWGKMKGVPVRSLWGENAGEMPLTDYTLGIDSLENMVRKMEEKPWPVYKVKMGFEGDVDVLKELTRHTTSTFRVDVNEGWTLSEAKQKIPALAEMGVELIEQPLNKADLAGMKELFSISPVPLFADESCVSEQDVERCQGIFHGINIKLTKCSGITPARRMIQRARTLGLKIMMGSMNETSIGSAAIAQFLPFLDYVDMDGPLLLAHDVASGISYDYGKVELSRLPGLGVQLSSAIF